MEYTLPERLIAFADSKRLAEGNPREVAAAVKLHADAHPESTILIFDSVTSDQVDFDLRGTVDDVVARLPKPAAGEPEPDGEQGTHRGPGRPKLGVVAREVTLLPRHWEWLASQQGGASVTLRKLVESARRESAGADRARLAQESTYRFTFAMAGNEPGFEDATRALYADDATRFEETTSKWPADIRDHARKLAADAFGW